MSKDQMKYFVEKRGNRELVCVLDTLEEARAIVQGSSDIIVCQTKARREEIRVVREIAKNQKHLGKQQNSGRSVTRAT